MRPGGMQAMIGAPEPLHQGAFDACARHAFAQVLTSATMQKYAVVLDPEMVHDRAQRQLGYRVLSQRDKEVRGVALCCARGRMA